MPPPAGYSGTPLAKKLGIKPGMTVYLHQAPSQYLQLLTDLPDDVRFVSKLPKSAAGMHLFVTDAQALATSLQRCLPRLDKDGMIWVSWPKKASKVKTDVTEDVIRKIALPMGLVDIRVCAVDETWSGLKLVIRKENRQQ
jgi:hypothetical protein